MGKQAELNRTRSRKTPAPAGRWKLEDAKARFSEVVRHAREDGPQRVTVRGHDAVVVMSVEEFERLAPEAPRAPFGQGAPGTREGPRGAGPPNTALFADQ